MIRALFAREFHLAFRQPGDWLNPLIFFLMVVTLFPLAVSADNQDLAAIAPGILWVAALLATLLALDTLFKQDYLDGSLEQMVVSGQSLSFIMLIKIIVQWLKVGLTLTLISPLLAIMMALPTSALLAMMSSLLIGTLALIAIGAVGAALTVSLRKGGVLLSLIVLPMFIPILIFGSSVVKAAAMGLPWSGHISLLGAYALFALVLCPFITALAVKVSISE